MSSTGDDDKIEWLIENMDVAARDAAQAAAKNMGIPVGEWMMRAIKGRLGVNPDDDAQTPRAASGHADTADTLPNAPSESETHGTARAAPLSGTEADFLALMERLTQQIEAGPGDIRARVGPLETALADFEAELTAIQSGETDYDGRTDNAPLLSASTETESAPPPSAEIDRIVTTADSGAGTNEADGTYDRPAPDAPGNDLHVEPDRDRLSIPSESPRAQEDTIAASSELRLKPGKLALAVVLFFVLIGGLAIVARLVPDETRENLIADFGGLRDRTAQSPDVANPQSASPDTENALALPEGGTDNPNDPIAALRAQAQTGNARAQFDLARRLTTPERGEPDYREAAEWFRAAATQGVVEAAYELGVMHTRGQGVARSPDDAAKWFRAAAEKGNSDAELALGAAYLRGEGVPQDYREAAIWFRKAADQGSAPAAYRLAFFYERGIGVALDRTEAYRWYAIAALGGHDDAPRRAEALRTSLSPETRAQIDTAVAETMRQFHAAADTRQSSATDLTARTAGPALPETAATPAAAPHLISDQALIAEIQRLLAELRLDPGPVNGAAGPQTQQAIRLYQEYAGLPVDGKPTGALLVHLRAIVNQLSYSHPPAPTVSTTGKSSANQPR